MGNNNSATNPSAQLGPHHGHDQWIRYMQNDDDLRMHRMRKGYPPKQYMGHRVSPQKVLPTVNPTKAAKKLKPTSNGRNLKQCGTISGRKNDLDVDSNSSSLLTEEMSRLRITSNLRQNGVSSPNLVEHLDPAAQPSRLSRRYGDSEPELHSRANGFGTVPPPPSHLQEAPAKKQIRTKVKKFAPPPPSETKVMPPSPLSQEVPNRLFKTKADRKTSSSSIEPATTSVTSSSVSAPKKEPSRISPNLIRLRNDKLYKSSPLSRTPESSSAKVLPKNAEKVQKPQVSPPSTKNVSEPKEELAEKKRFYFGMDLVDFASHQTRPNLEFDRNILKVQKVFAETAPLPKEESLSDNLSSSSEMDIVLRPTLPPKPQQLPKFSPSAAWNRIDLNSPNSSEEEAMRFKLKRGGSQALPKERLGEGDSGISGLDGDGGGSPEILAPQLPVASSVSKGSCWTPEQDLDESSSEFDGDDDDEHPSIPLQSLSSSDRQRLTTRSNFFANVKSDTELEPNSEPIYARSTKSKPIHSTSDGGALEFKPSLNRIINYRRTQKNKEVGLDANWFLSRSEPNSLNMTHLMIGDDAAPPRTQDKEDETGIQSENGYRSSVSYEITGNPPPSEWNKSASLISLSHFVYLPQQRERQGYYDETTKRNRRAKSVENLLKENIPTNKDKNQTQIPPQASNCKRKKFKFQSTLKVNERKLIEKQLSKEADEKESQRLKEIEAMKRVEQEFERKRKSQAEKKPEVSLPAKTPIPPTLKHWDEIHNKVYQFRQPLMKSTSPSRFSDRSSTPPSNITKVMLTQRQDPEGAPSAHDLRKELILGAKKRNGISSASSDLTQELSEYRQESRQYCDYRRSPRLSTEVTGKSKIRTKFVDSTSSDIYPLSGRIPQMEKHRQKHKSTVVYPEIVCDIPNKPFPYTVNFSSRLSGSHTSLLIEERPTSGIGFTSGPSSVISDNYRRDWAHHSHGHKHSGSSIGIGGKSSSITSLHSTSDNIRIHQSDLSQRLSNSPRITHSIIGRRSPKPKEPTEPRTVTITINKNALQQPRSLTEPVKELNGFPKRKPESCLQPQSFINYKTKSYRPVVFNPKPSANS